MHIYVYMRRILLRHDSASSRATRAREGIMEIVNRALSYIHSDTITLLLLTQLVVAIVDAGGAIISLKRP